MTSISTIGNPRYIAIETFRKNGEGVITPVWCAADGGKIYAMTERHTWKAKRILANPRVNVCASNFRGKPLGAWVEARATIQDSKDEILHGYNLLMAKYWLQYPLLNLVSPVMRLTSDVVIIRIESV